ncbi:hypothetical protein SSOG_09079 [Streptomyces himastatinicus ATCC 53653]|uniref:Uncharacterized protein n=1 Tax=Streptomyces himastatinicus ATCC 53653 TaxID=457427 RepID=D9WL90_9ACTN|nr:hypothetical protein [Streptomyces himastatinicus]EFL29365.1 hypothetical protein SSOG_09079 [Streptomyces himastatinicus ATCC 53653]
MSAGEQMTTEIPPTGLSWARAVVKLDHLRALTTLEARSVLIAGRAEELVVAIPDVAGAGCLTGEMRLQATCSLLLDAGLRESWKAGRLTGPFLEICTTEPASLNAAERGAA